MTTVEEKNNIASNFQLIDIYPNIKSMKAGEVIKVLRIEAHYTGMQKKDNLQ